MNSIKFKKNNSILFKDKRNEFNANINKNSRIKINGFSSKIIKINSKDNKIFNNPNFISCGKNYKQFFLIKNNNHLFKRIKYKYKKINTIKNNINYININKKKNSNNKNEKFEPIKGISHSYDEYKYFL